jgi:hypothetical protein
VAGGDGSQLLGPLRKTVSAPDHVQVGPQQQEIMTVDIPRPLFIQGHQRERRSIRGKCARERCGVGGRASQAEQGVTVAEAILQRNAVIEPYMREPGARPGRPAK